MNITGGYAVPEHKLAIMPMLIMMEHIKLYCIAPRLPLISPPAYCSHPHNCQRKAGDVGNVKHEEIVVGRPGGVPGAGGGRGAV